MSETETAPMLVDGEPVEMPAAIRDALPQPAPEPVPQSVTRFQARAVLRRQVLPDGRTMLQAIEGDLSAAVAAAAALPPTDPQRLAAEDAAEAWREAAVFERGSALVASIAGGLGLAEAQIDEMFRAAAEVTA